KPETTPGLASLTGYRAGKPDLHLASASHQCSPGERTDMTNPTTTRPVAIVSRRDFLRAGSAAAVLGPAGPFAAGRDDKPPDLLIGYTEFRTDLPGGRYVNVATRRAVVVKADGTGRRILAEELTREKGWSTQFTGWSPDGKTAIFVRSWESEENGKWEEELRTFRFSDE